MWDVHGFVDYRVDAVIKFGGSLLQDVDSCRRTVGGIASLSKLGKRVIVLPGGGPTDNTIEDLDQRAHFHPDTHHHACALAQDQTGLMISDHSFSSCFSPVSTLVEARRSLDQGDIPVLLPSRIIFAVDPFERSWAITSDSMAAWLAWLVHCRRVVILTDVDGLYPTDHIGDADSLIAEIDAKELSKFGHNVVDSCFAEFVSAKGIDGWVLNGAYPERIAETFGDESPRGTFIRGRSS